MADSTNRYTPDYLVGDVGDDDTAPLVGRQASIDEPDSVSEDIPRLSAPRPLRQSSQISGGYRTETPDIDTIDEEEDYTVDDILNETDTLLKRRQEEGLHLVSSGKTLMNIMKGMVGPGCLALPLALKRGGLWSGIGMLAVIGILNTYCMHMLVVSAQFLCGRTGKVELDYGHLAKKAFDKGPTHSRSWSKTALYATNTVVCIYQMGVCSVQFVFLAESLQVIFEFFSPAHYVISTQKLITFVLVPVIVVCMIRHLKFLSILATVGNFTMIIAFIIVFSLIIVPPFAPEHDLDNWFMSFDRFLLFLGSALYAFEGQAIILPMENKMEQPDDMIRPFGVLQTSMSLTTILYIATGFYGYLKFGKNTRGSITLNMPKEPLYQVVNIVIVASIYFGFALNLYVIITMLWPGIRRKMPEQLKPYRKPLHYFFRIIVILIQYSIAMAIPNLEQIVPLVGITAGMLISFIFPPILETMTFYRIWLNSESAQIRRKGFTNLMVAKNVALASFGCFGLVAGLYANIQQMRGLIAD